MRVKIAHENEIQIVNHSDRYNLIDYRIFVIPSAVL